MNEIYHSYHKTFPISENNEIVGHETKFKTEQLCY